MAYIFYTSFVELTEIYLNICLIRLGNIGLGTYDLKKWITPVNIFFCEEIKISFFFILNISAYQLIPIMCPTWGFNKKKVLKNSKMKKIAFLIFTGRCQKTVWKQYALFIQLFIFYKYRPKTFCLKMGKQIA